MTAQDLTVAKSMLCYEGFHAAGEIDLLGARIGGQLNLSGAHLDGQGGPRCGQASARVNGGYARTVADGAAGGRPVLIVLQVRRFRCRNPACPAVTFAEQAAGLSERYRRRSVPLLAMLAGFGLELAGRAAARLAGTLGIAVHPATVLRLVAAAQTPEITAAPEVLGVDDFALARGYVYGRCWWTCAPGTWWIAAGPGGRQLRGVAEARPSPRNCAPPTAPTATRSTNSPAGQD